MDRGSRAPRLHVCVRGPGLAHVTLRELGSKAAQFKTFKYRMSQFGRAVKAYDSKSYGISRAGSNPAVDAIFFAQKSSVIFSPFFYSLFVPVVVEHNPFALSTEQIAVRAITGAHTTDHEAQRSRNDCIRGVNIPRLDQSRLDRPRSSSRNLSFDRMPMP